MQKMFRMTIYAFFSCTLTLTAWGYPTIPNSKATPGSLCSNDNKDFAYYRYQQKIPYCERNVSASRKGHIYNIYKIPVKCRHLYTIDHFIPLAIGGDNSDKNLWPEHVAVKRTRPQLEYKLYRALEKSELTQKETIRIIRRAKMQKALQHFKKMKSKTKC